MADQQHKQPSGPCIWMQAGVVKTKMCRRDYDCNGCHDCCSDAGNVCQAIDRRRQFCQHAVYLRRIGKVQRGKLVPVVQRFGRVQIENPDFVAGEPIDQGLSQT